MLRWRLSLGLAALMALLIAVGIYAVWLFGNLGSAVNQVLENNYKNIHAIHEVRVATARINATYTTRATPQVLADKTAYFTNRKLVDDSIRTLEASAALSGQRDLLGSFEEAIRRYFSLYDAFFQGGPSNPDALAARLATVDVTMLITELGEGLLKFNEQAMFDADKTARHKSSDSIHFMLLAMALALLISGYASYRLGKSILEPIRLLTEFTGRIGAGDLDITAPVISEDELGKLASSFNHMAGKLRAYRQTTTERIFNLHQTMEATLAAFPDPIFVIDRDRQITLRNPAAARFSEDLGFGDDLPPELMAKVTEVLDSGMDYLPSSFRETFYCRIADQERSFLPRVLVMRGQDRTLQGVALVIQDVTRFRLLDDVKTNLVSTVSHELRTPLTSIRMALHILLEKKIGSLTPKQGDLLVVAREDSERLLRTLNDLLDLSRLEGGGHNLSLETTSPREIVSEVVQETEDAAQRHNLSLETDLPDHLSSIPMDRPRMKHVFLHFLDNAIKHSPSGAKVVVRVRPIGADVLRFSVLDQGEGVPAEYQSRIFDKFFRVPNQPKSGAGIGLSVARQIVEAHHGRVGVVSGPDGGSEFYCDLPVRDGAPQ